MRLPLLILLACLLGAARAAPPSPPTALEFGVAVEAGNLPAVQKWLDEGLPPDYMADRIGSGLMIAAWNGNLDMMRLFLSRGADVHSRNRFDEQALQMAAWRGHADAVELLLEHGADVNREDRQWNALHYAVFAGHDEIARRLMARGADPNARAPNGTTALMLAAREGKADLARLLLAAGADTAPVNEWGDNALAFAMRHKNYAIARMVSSAEDFARAARQAESYAPATKSVPAPPAIGELVEKLRRAQAEGKPTEHLRKALAAALALHRYDSEVQTLKTGKGGDGRPAVLVITAERRQAGRERAELLHEAVKAGAAVTTPAQADGGAESQVDIAGILDRLQQEQGNKRRSKRAEAELRKALLEAVAKFRQEARAEALR